MDKKLAYLDHNVLNFMLKNDPDKSIKKWLREHNLAPTYSIISLDEIRKSVKREQEILGLLSELNACYLEEQLDENDKPTGRYLIHTDSPFEIFNLCKPNCLSNPREDGHSVHLLMSKFFGGQENSSFQDLFKGLGKEALILLEDLDEEDYDAIPELKKLKEDALSLANSAPECASELDKLGGSPLAAFENYTGLGPRVLNNIEPPRVVEQIWRLILEKTDIPKSLDFNTFWGIDDRNTIQENVDNVYHQLNFVGYYRDSKLHKEKKLLASMNDKSHVGFAAQCHYLLSSDAGLTKKANAVFELLGLTTEVVSIQ